MDSRDVKVGAKIERQLSKRGWTLAELLDAVTKPIRTIATKDMRHLPDGLTVDEPATAYLREDGHYVVANDMSGDVVQISDRTRDWRSPFEEMTK